MLLQYAKLASVLLVQLFQTYNNNFVIYSNL